MFGRTNNSQNKNQKPIPQDENVRKEAELEEDELDEDSYDDTEETDYDDETNEELKDLVVIDEDELELEE